MPNNDVLIQTVQTIYIKNQSTPPPPHHQLAAKALAFRTAKSRTILTYPLSPLVHVSLLEET